MIVSSIARVKGAGEFKFVDGVASAMAAMQSNPVAAPAVYLFQTNYRPGQNQLTGGGISQRITVTMTAIMAIQVLAPKGGQAQDLIEPYRVALQDKLFGWSPAEGYDPFELGDSNFLNFRDNYLWWKDDFVSRFTKRSY